MNPTPLAFPDPAADPILTLAWVATSSVAAGALLGTAVACGSIRGERAIYRIGALFLVPLLIAGLAVLSPPGASWSPLGALPTPWSGGFVLVGLLLLGASFAPWQDARSGWPVTAVAATGLTRSAALFLAAACLDGAAVGWGLVVPRPPWSPAVTGFLLDLSPRTLLLEAGGVDWMRHEMVYGPAGTDRLGPGIRTAWDGSVAGPLLLVVGCTAAAFRCGARAR